MTTKIRTIIGAGLALSLVMGWFSYCDKDGYGIDCSNSSAQLDTSLPLSHPQNRCASGAQQDVSWASWLSGSGQGIQFHFLDLLELLSRSSDNNTDHIPAN